MLLLSPSDWPDLQTMLSTLSGQIPDLVALATAFSYIAGLFFMLRATYVLKEYGELRTMMSSQTSLVKPMTLYIIAVLFLFFPTTYHYAMETFFGQYNATPYGYSSVNYQSWHGIISVVVQIIEFLGIIAFMRGLFLMTALAGGQSPQGTIGKGLAHLVGGIMAMNIVGVSYILERTLGITVS